MEVRLMDENSVMRYYTNGNFILEDIRILRIVDLLFV